MLLRSFLLGLIIMSSVPFFGIETGKILNLPMSSKKDLNGKDGIMISEKIAKTGFQSSEIAFETNLPVFSLLKHNDDIIAGTGDFAMIINVSKKETLAVFNEGELIYGLEEADKNSIIAIIQPSGCVVRLTGKKIDTLLVLNEKSINLVKKISGKIYIAAGNDLLVFKGNGFEKAVTVDDRNIIGLYPSGSDIYIATEGDGKIYKYSNGSKELVFSSAKSEITFVSKKDNALYFVQNQISGVIENADAYQSFLIKAEKDVYDTIFKGEANLSPVAERFGGFLMFSSVPAGFYFYDYENVFFCGSFDIDFIMTAVVSDDGVLVGTAKPGKCFLIKEKKEPSAYISSVIDFLKTSRITSISPDAGGKGKLYVRTGFVENVDSSWTDFMLVKPGMNEEMKECRFAQYKYLFSKQEDALKKVSIFYKGINHNPSLKNINVYPPRIIPDYANSEDLKSVQVLRRSMYPEVKDNLIFKTDSRVIFVSWQGMDSDGDKIAYDIALTDESGIYYVKKEIYEPYALIHTDGFSEGLYKIEITANDSFDNSRPLYGKLISDDLYIDNTPPEFENDLFEKNILKFNVKDDFSNIDEVRYSVNGSSFKSAIPKDEIFDSKSENFEIKIERDSGEQMFILVYCYDVYGNIGVLKKAIK